MGLTTTYLLVFRATDGQASMDYPPAQPEQCGKIERSEDRVLALVT